MNLDSEGTQIGLTVVTLVASYFLARWFGDKAGTEAAIKYEEEKDARAHIITLQRLLAESTRISTLLEENAERLKREGEVIKTIAYLPTAIFKTASLSKESTLYTEKFPDENEIASLLISEILTYITRAELVNSYAETYRILLTVPYENRARAERAKIVAETARVCKEMRSEQERLEDYIRQELERARAQSQKKQHQRLITLWRGR